MRRTLRRQPVLAMVLSGALLGGALTGCSIAPPAPETTTEEAPVAEFGNVTEAVTAAVPRVVGAQDPGRSRNGLGERIDLTLMVDSAEPLTADELDAVAEAIWRALPWEPNTIALVAGAETSDGVEPVDLRTAAADLSPMGFTNAGQGGVSLFDMKARYGDWSAPE
ncbi:MULTISPECIES: hypothetical protein [unclassified Microbacterium]|uniref:hypothetical protein n=1 Tax=unclassified Microbacterium TaxID=2609290 RepID=UPI00386BBE10